MEKITRKIKGYELSLGNAIEKDGGVFIENVGNVFVTRLPGIRKEKTFLSEHNANIILSKKYKEIKAEISVEKFMANADIKEV